MATKAKHTESNGKDIIAQSHHMPLSCVPSKNVIPLHTMLDNILYVEQHYPSSAKQTWLTY